MSPGGGYYEAVSGLPNVITTREFYALGLWAHTHNVRGSMYGGHWRVVLKRGSANLRVCLHRHRSERAAQKCALAELRVEAARIDRLFS